MSFTFKRFNVGDARTPMKVGTDGVLLGAWVDIAGATRIVDVGAGSGLISLMLAQRTAQVEIQARIMAVENYAPAAADSADNFVSSPWGERLQVVCKSFADAKIQEPNLIVSNPPFFATTLKSPDAARAAARHGGELNYISLIAWAARVLSADGSLAMVTEYAPHSDIVFEAEMAGLKLRRFCAVCQVEGREPTRALWQFGRVDGPVEKQVLVIRTADGDYTDEYIALTRDFYLNL